MGPVVLLLRKVAHLRSPDCGKLLSRDQWCSAASTSSSSLSALQLRFQVHLFSQQAVSIGCHTMAACHLNES